MKLPRSSSFVDSSFPSRILKKKWYYSLLGPSGDRVQALNSTSHGCHTVKDKSVNASPGAQQGIWPQSVKESHRRAIIGSLSFGRYKMLCVSRQTADVMQVAAPGSRKEILTPRLVGSSEVLVAPGPGPGAKRWGPRAPQLRRPGSGPTCVTPGTAPQLWASVCRL